MSEKIGRLAMRVEGKNWNAYYALNGTMEGSVYLGSIAMRFVQDPVRKHTFMMLMRDAVSDILEEITGQRPTWPDGIQPAPDHERFGNS
jgi:hypothetical protein